MKILPTQLSADPQSGKADRHGAYPYHPDDLHLAIQVREMADTLTTPRTPEWKR